MTPTAADVLACRDQCVEFLQSVADHDWTAAIPDLEMNVLEVAGHVAQANAWYSLDLAAGGVDVEAVVPEVKIGGGPEPLIRAFEATATMLAAVVRGTSDDVRGFHPWGQADRSGFAAISCDEMIVHTHDISRGLGTDFAPSSDLASKVLHRLFPWATQVDDDPWTSLRWANGRIALPGHDRKQKWLWHCAPLAEWDGTEPTAPPPPPT